MKFLWHAIISKKKKRPNVDFELNQFSALKKKYVSPLGSPEGTNSRLWMHTGWPQNLGRQMQSDLIENSLKPTLCHLSVSGSSSSPSLPGVFNINQPVELWHHISQIQLPPEKHRNNELIICNNRPSSGCLG